MKTTKDEQIKRLKKQLKESEMSTKRWETIHIALYGSTCKELVKARKTVELLLPLVNQTSIERLLGELYDLREKEETILKLDREEKDNK